MNTRNNKIQELLNSSDPEEMVRQKCSSMAAPQPEDNNDQQRTSDMAEEEVSHRGDIPHTYIPDLANTILSEAIRDGMMLGTDGKEYLILTPKLKEHIGLETQRSRFPWESWKSRGTHQ